MPRIVSRCSLLSVAVAGLLLSGCASMDDIKRAQSTADQALSTAQEAKEMAADAQSKANAAQQGVDQLRTEEHSEDQTTVQHHGGERG